MVVYLSKKPKLSFVDDPGKLYRQRRRATQAKALETLDSRAEVEVPSKSPRESPPPSPKEDQPQPPPMGEQPQPKRAIELCTLNIVNLPIINLQDAGRPFKIKVTTIRMVQHSPFIEALEHFNEYMRAEFLEWHIDFLKRRMEKMEIEREAQELKAAEANPHARSVRSTTMSMVKPDLTQVRTFKIWFLFVHNSRTSWTSKLRSTRTPSLSSRLWRKYWRI
jgi:hypothetical protein